MIRSQAALRHSGLPGVPMVNVENACASGGSAFAVACWAIGSGSARTVLVVGAEKLTHPDRERTRLAASAGYDHEEPPHANGTDPASSPAFFMELYASMAQEYLKRTGASAADLADVAAKNHRHGSLNPKAQYQRPLSRADVLSSRMIADPLTLTMCSPIGDGAAALVLTTPDAATAAGRSGPRVRACAIGSGRDLAGGEPDAITQTARRAYEHAGLGPGDLDLAEIHDAAAPAELIAYERLGLCAENEGPRLLAEGATTLGGRIPVNTGGGLLARGHPIAATGCAQLVELTDQLRGRAGARQVPSPRLALAESAGGYLQNDTAAVAVTILEADRHTR